MEIVDGHVLPELKPNSRWISGSESSPGRSIPGPARETGIPSLVMLLRGARHAMDFVEGTRALGRGRATPFNLDIIGPDPG